MIRVIFLAVGLLMCVSNVRAQTLNDDLRIPDSQIASLEDQAMAGDGSAAVKLALHFMTVGDGPASAEWGRIAAENGDGAGMWNYAVSLSISHEHQSDLRAIYWLKKVAALNNDPEAANANKKIKEIEARSQK